MDDMFTKAFEESRQACVISVDPPTWTLCLLEAWTSRTFHSGAARCKLVFYGSARCGTIETLFLFNKRFRKVHLRGLPAVSLRLARCYHEDLTMVGVHQ